MWREGNDFRSITEKYFSINCRRLNNTTESWSIASASHITSNSIENSYVVLVLSSDDTCNILYFRVMISKEGMERLSFIKEVRVGEKLLINGVLENMVVPNVFGNLLVVSAKEALRFEETKTSNGEALSIV